MFGVRDLIGLRSVTPWFLMMPLLIARFGKLLLASQATSARLSSDYNSWILRHTWLAMPRYIWRAITALFLVLASIHYAVASTNTGCFFAPAAFLVQVVFLVSWLTTITAMIVHLRHVHDAFYVVAELKLLCVLILVSEFVVIALQLIGQPDYIVFVFMVYGPVQNAIQIWFPVLKSFSRQFVERPKRGRVEPLRACTADTESAFRQVLQDPGAFQALKRFMTLELSVENLMCWEQLHSLERDHSPEAVAALFMIIHQVYIRDGAPNQVNISSRLKVLYSSVTLPLDLTKFCSDRSRVWSRTGMVRGPSRAPRSASRTTTPGVPNMKSNWACSGRWIKVT